VTRIRIILAGLLAVGMTAVPSSASAADLLGYWPLNEGAGQVAVDATGLGHDGGLGSSTGPDGNDPSWIAGRFGSGLRFLGDRDQHVLLRKPSGLQPTRITVDAWVRRLGTPGRWRYVVSSGAVGCDFASYGLYTGFNGGLAFYVSDADHFVLSPELADDAVWDGSWHRAVGTYDGQHVRLYVDGTQVGAGTPSTLTIAYGSNANAYLGTYHGSCERPFTGDVDDVRISSGVASSETIRETSLQDAAKPLPAQVTPVAGPPATGVPPTVGGCLTVRATPRKLVAGRRTTLRISVKSGKRPVSRRTVSVRGLGIKRNKRTAGAGSIKLKVTARRRGTVKVTVDGQPRRCTKRISVKSR
jgi:Concanavalin A-like lectin/glucanases superfamily